MKIKDVCTYAPKSSIKAGDATADGQYMFFTSSEDESKRYREYQFDGEGIVMGTGGNATLHYYNGKFAVSTDCVVLLPNNKLRCKYLYYFFLANLPILEAGFKGAGLKHTNKGYIGNIELEIPSLESQDNIISVLDRVFDAIRLRNNELSLFNDLVKARFVEMFGNYPANPMGWKTGKIRDTVADVRYGSSRPAVDGGKYPYLRMNNITYGGELDLSDVKRIDVPENELDKCTVRRGDVLFNRTNSKELVGKTCVYDRDEMMVLAGFVIRVRVNDQVLPEFLSAFLNTDFSKKTLSEMCKTAIGQANINAQEMQNIGLYLPPLELQRQFVQFKKQVDKSKVVESIYRMNILFNITLNGGNRYDS